MTADWPTEAREIVARHMQRGFEPRSYALAQADKLLAALAPHVQPRTDDWEWGVRTHVDREPVSYGSDEASARTYVQSWLGRGKHDDVVRRHPASPWEVAP